MRERPRTAMGASILLALGAAGCTLPGMPGPLSFEVHRQADIEKDIAVELRLINQSLVAIALETARQQCSCRRDP
jgi:hypothetical protein